MRWFRSLIRRPLATVVVVGAALAAGGAAYWRHQTEQLLRQGEQALTARDYAAARTLLERYLAIRPGDVSARLLAARAARRQPDLDGALAHLRRCRDDGGDIEAIDAEYALIGLKRGDDQQAPWLRGRALQDDLSGLTILEGLIQYDLDTYQLWQALADFGEYLQRRPTDVQALLGRGFVWERFLSFADALVDYRRAVEAHPNNPPARLRLADTLLLVGTPEEALVHYQWLADHWHKRPEVRLGLARCLHRLGKLAEAQDQLDALLADAPHHGEANWERGRVALDQNQPAAAEPWLQRAAQVLPFDQRVYYSLERCLRALGRGAEAEKCQVRAAQLATDVRRLDQVRLNVLKRPNDAALWCEAGQLFLRNGERQEGLRWLQTALRLDPTLEPARKSLAEHQGH